MEWRVDKNFVDYKTAVADMEARADAIRAGTADERVWLLEHPPLYTAGTSAQAGDLLAPNRFPVHATGRGGQYT
ncbi:MAG: lipoate-protein ligase B, partial [Elsteraceae bacterium]